MMMRVLVRCAVDLSHQGAEVGSGAIRVGDLKARLRFALLILEEGIRIEMRGDAGHK